MQWWSFDLTNRRTLCSLCNTEAATVAISVPFPIPITPRAQFDCSTIKLMARLGREVGRIAEIGALAGILIVCCFSIVFITRYFRATGLKSFNCLGLFVFGTGITVDVFQAMGIIAAS